MLIITRRPSEDGALGSSFTIGGVLQVTVERHDARGVMLRYRNSTGGRGASRVPYQCAVSPMTGVRIIPLSPLGGVARIGIDAPRHISVLRDDAKKRWEQRRAA